MGGSRQRSSVSPRSVIRMVALTVCHPRRAAVATNAAAGPFTLAQMFLADLRHVTADETS